MEPWIVFAAVCGVIGFFVLASILKAILVVCPPHHAVVISGRTHTLPSGKRVGYTVKIGGRAYRIPVLEKVDVLDLRVLDVHLLLKNAYAKGGVPLNVEAIANIKVTDNEAYIGNAVERFLGLSREEIRQTGKETLEGHLRGVIAKLTPEQCNEDRLRLMEELGGEAEEDLMQLGLHLDTFNIHQISDDTGYLEAIGREKIAVVQREVEIAKSDADRAAKEQEALWTGKAAVSREQAEAVISEKKNEARRVRAELEAQARSEEETAEAKGKAAQAVAEKELQEVRAELEKLRLEADVVVPAEAENQARVFRARGDAAPQAERGRALAESLVALSEVWRQAGPDARTIFVLQRIERLLEVIVNELDVTIEEANLVDDGSGRALPQFVASQVASVRAVLDQLQGLTGLDLAAAMNGPGGATALEGGA